ncbi:unnamed protein product [Closterium sp. Yama58-4]|nr:unnamed protein product [Closterium sp. Yama58-4]
MKRQQATISRFFARKPSPGQPPPLPPSPSPAQPSGAVRVTTPPSLLRPPRAAPTAAASAGCRDDSRGSGGGGSESVKGIGSANGEVARLPGERQGWRRTGTRGERGSGDGKEGVAEGKAEGTGDEVEAEGEGGGVVFKRKRAGKRRAVRRVLTDGAADGGADGGDGGEEEEVGGRFGEDELGERERPWKREKGAEGGAGDDGTKLTPLEEQVVALKRRHPDVLLLVEVGYKYRFFGADADVAARVLCIYCHVDRAFLTASIPTFRLHVHVRRLVEAGFKVGVVRQSETAAIKAHGSNKAGPFGRHLSALYTRATTAAAAFSPGPSPPTTDLDSSHGWETDSAAGMQAGSEGDVRIGLVAVETSTGDVAQGFFTDGVLRGELETHLAHFSPTEIVLTGPITPATHKLLSYLSFRDPAPRITTAAAPDGIAGAAVGGGGSGGAGKAGGSGSMCGVRAALAEFFAARPNGAACTEVAGKGHAEGNGGRMKEREEQQEPERQQDEQKEVDPAVEAVLSMPPVLLRALAAAVDYLKEFNLHHVLALGGGFRPLCTGHQMTLSSNALEQLEFVRVLSALVSAAQQLRSLLPDPSHATTTTTATSAADTDTDPDSSNDTPKVKSALLQRLLRAAASPAVVRHARRMLSAVDADAAARGDKVNLVVCAAPSHHSQQQQERKQYDSNHHIRGVLDDEGEEAAEPSLQFPELWACREAVREAEGQLNSLLPAIRSQLRLPSLSFFSVSGVTHLIEVPSALRVPSDWLKHSAVKAGKAGGVTRYHPTAVLAGLDRLALAKEAAAAAAGRAWQELLEGFRGAGGGHVELRQAVKALAELDCLCALAAVSASKGYVRPEFFKEDGPQNVLIKNGRHPVLDVTMGSEFVPNDTMLMGEGERCHVITGPNMGGKSCYIRQVALICIMAQIGCYVPADSARLHVLDAVLTRMGAANDSLARRTSTFLEELAEASGILRRATGRSLVIVDELGRGTSTHDGVAIAYATLHVSNRFNSEIPDVLPPLLPSSVAPSPPFPLPHAQYLLSTVRCLTLFVTHYPEIAQLEKELPGAMGSFHMSFLASTPPVPPPSAAPPISACGQKQLSDPVTSGSDEQGEAKPDQQVTFLYKLVRGVASRSFGLNVARLAQVPESVVQQAAAKAAKLEHDVLERRKSRRSEAASFRRGHGDHSSQLVPPPNEGITNEPKLHEAGCPETGADHHEISLQGEEELLNTVKQCLSLVQGVQARDTAQDEPSMRLLSDQIRQLQESIRRIEHFRNDMH